MKPEKRLFILKIAAGGMIAFAVLFYMVLEPALARWDEQSDRIAALRKKVEEGQKLINREDALRQQWANMMRASLPEEVSAAENEAFKAIGRWAQNSGIIFTSLTPQWEDHDDTTGGKPAKTYQTLECRISANGTQASIGRFLYELETDSIPVNLEECEITTRDTHGSQILLTAHFSFLRLPQPEGNTR